MRFVLFAAALILCVGCGSGAADENKPLPIVNPLAPGAKTGQKFGGPTSDQQFQAAPGVKTGIPK